jgi:SAM-dependent methyltransferase
VAVIGYEPDILAAPGAALREGDAMGELLRDFFHTGRSVGAVAERSDGYALPDLPAETYFAGVEEWTDAEREALGRAKGRILDLGCGAGRHSLYLQEKGSDVLGIDSSPGAIAVSRARGLHNTLRIPVQNVSARLGRFDTVLMMCTNFGLAGTRHGTRALLRTLTQITGPTAKVIGHTLDPHVASQPEHREYRTRNVALGRMPGQMRVRVRYRLITTPWYELLYLALNEVRQVVAGTGWEITDVIRDPDPTYFVILGKD